MAVTYVWGVTQLEAYPEQDGQTDVVCIVHWTLTGEEDGRVAGVYGSVGVQLEAGSHFTPYAELTEEQVVGWAKAKIGAEEVAELEAQVAYDIAQQAAPSVVAPPLPWA
jgi:hypothetical protein